MFKWLIPQYILSSNPVSSPSSLRDGPAVGYALLTVSNVDLPTNLLPHLHPYKWNLTDWERRHAKLDLPTNNTLSFRTLMFSGSYICAKMIGPQSSTLTPTATINPSLTQILEAPNFNPEIRLLCKNLFKSIPKSRLDSFNFITTINPTGHINHPASNVREIFYETSIYKTGKLVTAPAGITITADARSTVGWIRTIQFDSLTNFRLANPILRNVCKIIPTTSIPNIRPISNSTTTNFRPSHPPLPPTLEPPSRNGFDRLG